MFPARYPIQYSQLANFGMQPDQCFNNRAEGALSMRAPESIVGIQTFRRREIHGGARCARRSCFTHRETVVRELALAPAPGKVLRSVGVRASRIYRLELVLSAATDTQSRASSAGVVWAASSVLVAPKAHLR